MAEQSPEHIQRIRIVKALREKQDSLDLSNLGLTILWEGLWQLTNLTSLNLSNNKLTNLPPEFWQLTNLTSLDLSYTGLTTLPAEIGQLTNLASLHLSGNQLTTLPIEIGQLANITSLRLWGNQLTAVPVEIGRLTNLTSLDLSTNRLTVIPTEIGQLICLISLNLSNNQLTALPSKIGQLTNLALLDLRGNQLTVLPAEIGQLVNLTSLELLGNKLTSLPVELRQLTRLTRLCASWNNLTALPAEIGNLTNLTSLELFGCHLTTLPTELWRLTKLTKLGLGDTGLTALPAEIGQLTELTSLNLSGNRLTTLPAEIGQLTNLTELVLSYAGLTTLPAEIGQIARLNTFILSNRDRSAELTQRNKIKKIPVEILGLKSLKKLDLRDNTLDIPPEILERVDEPQSILDYYFARLKRPLNEVKVILVGQGSVGKTSLVQRILLNTFNTSQTKTEGIYISRWQTENQSVLENQQSKIQLNIWDFGGQEIMRATHQFFLTKRSLYLLILDSRTSQEDNRVEYWLKIIQSFGGESPVLIVGNKIDQHPLDIDRTGLQKKYPNIVGILETSAATGAGIEELKAAITEQVNHLPHVRDLLPETWFTVKTKLEGLGRESNFITHDKYLELCAENEVSDETSQRTLIGFLHDLGVVLHFQDDPRLEALGILNPQWVTNGVYKILNSHTLFQNKGVLTVAMLDEILNLPEYPRGKRLFIVDMMKKFELCYDIEPDKTFLVPDLLPKDEPLLTFNGIPAFEYAYPVLPSSVITRFIVRMNQKIDDSFVWRTGVLLKIGSNNALVKADIEDRKITIAIDGPEHTRRDALSAIRYQLDEIHASIKGLNPEKRVPIREAPNAEPLEYEYLLMLERAGDETCRVKDGNRLVTVNVRQVLSGVENESARKDRGGNEIHIHVGGEIGGNLIVGDGNSSTNTGA